MHINTKPEFFTFSEPIQVRWTDLDPLAHVNNSIYIQYFEIARGQYMLKAAPSWSWNKDMFLLANVSCNYIKELKIGQPNTRCWVRTKEMGNKSFILEYMITTGEGEIHTMGSTTQVMFDTKTRKTIEIPDWLREEIKQYEKPESVVMKS